MTKFDFKYMPEMKEKFEEERRPYYFGDYADECISSMKKRYRKIRKRRSFNRNYQRIY